MNNLKNFFHDCVDDFNENVTANGSNMLRILQWNVRGINAVNKFDNILEFLDNLCVSVDVIVLCETWLKEVNCSLFNVRGYKSIFSCRDSSSGGLALYVRNSIEHQIHVNTCLDGFHHMHVGLKLNGLHYNVHGVYRPPSFDFNNFQVMLENWLSTASQTCPTFIVGDINIPINLINNNVVVKYKNLIESYGYLCTNTFATRPVSCNILDHVVCSLGYASALQNDTIFSNISDHLPIITSLKINARNDRMELSKKIINHTKLNADFKAYLDSIVCVNDVDSCLTNIVTKYNNLLQDCTTIVTKLVKIKGTQCPWMTLGLWQLIKIKNYHLKKVKRNPQDNHAKSMLNHVSKKVEKFKNIAKKTYYANILNNTTHSKLWKHINIIFGRSKTANKIALNVNGSIISDNLEVCNLFNNHFSNIGRNLANSIPLTDIQNPIEQLHSIRESIFLQPCSPNEVLNIIHDLKTNKAPGPDNIPSLILKTNASVFSNILSESFNKIISTGQYPECLKLAKVSPIFKSGDPCLLDNYRPISTLSVFSKVFEVLLVNRLLNFFGRHNLLYKFQYGFRQSCSTETALVELVDFITKEVDCKKIVGALFIDLKKAFDTLDHDILLAKLNSYGVRGVANNLLRSYLSERKQYVYINHHKSAIEQISTGVPQGSNIGPLLFLIYINDLGNLRLNGTPRLFADDTALFYPDISPTTVIDHINQDLEKLKIFFASNLLSLNINKTKYMIFQSPRKSLPIHDDPKLGDIIIDKVDSFKYLGLHLDSKFSWEIHIKHVERKVATLCGVLSRVSCFVPQHVLLKFYHAHIHSQLQYVVIVWGRACRSKLLRLQTLQNRCLKIIFKLPPLHPTIDLYGHSTHTILPLIGLCELQSLVMVHNIINNRIHSNISLHSVNVPHNTRQTGNLALSRAFSNHGQRRISYIGPSKFNSLPNELKLITNKCQFKLKVKLYLKENINEFIL